MTTVELGQSKGFSISLDRLVFVLLAGIFLVTVRYLYLDVIVKSQVLSIYGFDAQHVHATTSATYLVIAVLPALFCPINPGQPSNFLVSFLYLSVVGPTLALFPYTSWGTSETQYVFCACLLASFAILCALGRLPRLNWNDLVLGSVGFWVLLVFAGITCETVLISSGFLNLTDLSFVNVYAKRALLASAISSQKVSVLVLYVAGWSAFAIGPTLLSYGLLRKRYELALLGLALSFSAFVVTGNKVYYVALLAVIGVMPCIVPFRGRYAVHLLVLAWIGLSLACSGFDALYFRNGPPILSFAVPFRSFIEPAFLSAKYSDYFSQHPIGFYADGFLSWVPGHRYETNIPAVIGLEVTVLPMHKNEANANLWADAFANAWYPGIFLATLALGVLLLVYDSLAMRKGRIIATVWLITPAIALTNTSLNTALLSSGWFLMFLFVMLVPPPPDTEEQAGHSEGGVAGPSLDVARRR